MKNFPSAFSHGRQSLIVFGILLIFLAAASAGMGLTWDESIYFIFSDSIRRWWKNGMPFDAASLQSFWNYSAYHNPHPPLMKILSAVSSGLFHGILPFPLDYRLAHLAFVAFGLTVFHEILAREYSRIHAAGGLGMILLQPQFFGHTLLATTDSVTAVTWFVLPALLFAMEKESEAGKSLLPEIAFTAIFAAGAATKFTAFLALLPLLAFSAVRKRPRSVKFLLLAGIIALATVIIVSPDKWLHSAKGLQDYLSHPFQRGDIPITAHYFGKNFAGTALPWHYFFVMSWYTVPSVILLSLPGILLGKPKDFKFPSYYLFPLLFWLVLMPLPGVPRHDGVRQFISFFPLLGIFSFTGWAFYCRKLPPSKKRLHNTALLLPSILMAVVLWTTHPFELSYYNALAGGVKGAEKKGLEMTYWFEPIWPGLIEALNKNAPTAAAVALIPNWPNLLKFYQREGRLRNDLRIVDLQDGTAEEILICRRRSLVNDGAFLRLEAVAETRFDGVPLAKFAEIRPPLNDRRRKPLGGSHDLR